MINKLKAMSIAISCLILSSFSKGMCSETPSAQKYDGFSYGYSQTVTKTFDAGPLGTINQYSDGSYSCPPNAQISSSGGNLTITTGIGSYLGDPVSETYKLTEKK